MPKDSKKKSISEIMPASKQKTIVDDANNTLMKLKKNGMGLEQALEHSLDEDMTMVSEYLKEMEKKGIYGTAGDEDLEHPEGLTPDQAAFFHSTNWIQYLNSEDKAAVADAFFRLLVTDYRKTVQTSFNALKKETNESTLKQAVATLQVFSDQLPPRCKGFMPNHQESPNAVFAILRNLSKMFLDLEPNFDMIDRYLKQKQAKSNVAKKQEFMIKWLQFNECTKEEQEDIIEDLADECDMIRLGEIVTQLHVQHNVGEKLDFCISSMITHKQAGFKGSSRRTAPEGWDPNRGFITSKCDYCGKTPVDGIQACAACRGAFYCSVKCQGKDWKKHRDSVCRQISDYCRNYER